MKKSVLIIGGGLAGVEAAYQLAKRDIAVDLYEMRPGVMTEAHDSGFLGEMVCSNSLGSLELNSASGLLKEELQRLDSFYLRLAEQNRVPAGNSLSTDRLRLAEQVDREIASLANIRLIREEVQQIPKSDVPIIIASGPLTSPALATSISGLTLRKNLFFFDATSPLVNADSIDTTRMFRGSRYNKGAADFLNIPLDKESYDAFVRELVNAEIVEMKEFEQRIFFDACLPIEEIARRGEKSLAYGPLKPVGLSAPGQREMPYAVVQLRQDDLHGHFFQLVGFQTRLKWPEQKRIFRMLPGLEKAEFERFGRMHRNTFINAPLIINELFQDKGGKNIFFAGQLSGVEGYVESIASGLLCGLFVARLTSGKSPQPPPETTASGALIHYIAHANWKEFRPSKFSFGLIPDFNILLHNKKQKKEAKAQRALEDLEAWKRKLGI